MHGSDVEITGSGWVLFPEKISKNLAYLKVVL
jgi:hypothetical protein